MSHRSSSGRHSGHQQQHDDHYVKGDTNWESYNLPQLIAMVTDKVNIPALLEQADDWRAAGEEMQESARELGRALDRMMDFWSGAAANQARNDVALNAQWVADLGVTATEVGGPVEEAAGALKAAQDQMPTLPPSITPVIARGSAPQGASEAGFAAGPLGEAIGGVAEGSQSAAQAAEAEAKLKRQAVETMQRFETVAMGIEGSIPVFEGPSSVLRRNPAPEPRPTPPPPPPGLIVNTDVRMSWRELTGTSAANYGGHGGGAGGGGAGIGVPAGAGTGFELGQGPMAGRSAGTGSGAGGMAGERVGLPAANAMPIDADGHHPGMAGGGAPMGGMGAGAGGGAGNDHRRRFPFEADDPFTLDEKASPPVIGL